MWSAESVFIIAFPVVALAFALLPHATAGELDAPDNTEALDNWFNEGTNPLVYKKWIRPSSGLGPVRVNVSLHFYTVAILDEVTAVRVLDLPYETLSALFDTCNFPAP
jgi:hypothetical protein